jgi:hypothetical protein
MTATTIAVGSVLAIVLVIACELLLRVALRWRGRYYVWQPGRKLELRPDAASHPRLEPVVRFDINEDGERGPPAPGKNDRVFRILAAGGSTVESFLLNHETSWPGALQRVLGTPEALAALGRDRVHVGNIGKSGVGAAALELIFARLLPRYRQLDLIVIMVGASDVVLWLQTGCTEVAKAPLDDYFVWHPEGPFGISPRHTAAWEMLRRVRDRWQARSVERRDNVAKWMGRARTMRANAAEIRDETPDPAPMLEAFDRHFRAALEHARAHADRVLVLHQPCFEKDSYAPEELALFWNGGVGKAVFENVSVFYSNDVIFRLMRAVRELAARACDDAGVEQLDLMPVLERSVNTYYDHLHHTPVGAAMIASVVGDHVLRAAAAASALGCSSAPASLTVAKESGIVAASSST